MPSIAIAVVPRATWGADDRGEQRDGEDAQRFDAILEQHDGADSAPELVGGVTLDQDAVQGLATGLADAHEQHDADAHDEHLGRREGEQAQPE